MKTELMPLVNSINGTRAKIYYQLNQLEPITGLSVRSLKYRMTVVKEKYKDVPNLLCRIGRTWRIHHTIINEFLPIYKKKQTTVSNHRWETLLTWNMKDNYDVQYHIQLVNEVKEELPTANIAYVIEKDSRGTNHLHAISDGDKSEVAAAVETVLSRYITKKDYRSQIAKINNTSSVVGYLRKSNEITIL